MLSFDAFNEAIEEKERATMEAERQKQQIAEMAVEVEKLREFREMFARSEGLDRLFDEERAKKTKTPQPTT